MALSKRGCVTAAAPLWSQFGVQACQAEAGCQILALALLQTPCARQMGPTAGCMLAAGTPGFAARCPPLRMAASRPASAPEKRDELQTR